MKGIRKVSTRGMSREEWLMQRRKTIGGSDAAGIVGLSKWASPFSVWAEKTGRTAEKEDTEAMRQGRVWRTMWPAAGWRRRANGSIGCQL